jgi:hypothetical protein
MGIHKIKITAGLLWCLLSVTGSGILPVAAAENPAPRKSPVKAFVMSLVVPGTGEYYLGHRTAAATFWTMEAGLWLSAVGFKTYSVWRAEDAKAYAAQTAGVDLDAVDKAGNNENYFRALGDYQNLDEYNHEQRVNGTTGDQFGQTLSWQWPDDRERVRYLTIRRSAKLATNRVSYMFGVITVNHLLSALNTIRLVKAQDKAAALQTGVGCLYEPDRERVVVSWWKQF